MFTTQDRWSVSLKYISDILQSEEAFTVAEYKHTHARTHKRLGYVIMIALKSKFDKVPYLFIKLSTDSWEETADLVTFTEEILNEKRHFLCSVSCWNHEHLKAEIKYQEK